MSTVSLNLADAGPTTVPVRQKTEGHWLALDGVRGLAVLLVIVHHLNRMNRGGSIDQLMRGVADFGWIGVDLFFVLSGFLITGILFDAKPSVGKPADRYFLNFYARRVLRIFPLLYVFLLFFLVILPWLSPSLSNEFGVQPRHPWMYWLYLSNYSLVNFDIPAHVPLSVTWSLAIEEQFYFVWPAVVLLCNRRTLILICWVIIAVALAWRVDLILHGGKWLRLYYPTQCRMDSLAFGALCALSIRDAGGVEALWQKVRWGLPVVVLVVLVVFVQQRSSHWIGGLGQTIGYTSLGALSAALVLAAIRAQPDDWLYLLFANGPMRFFGRYSYAMYLFHLPVSEYVAKHLFNPHTFVPFGQSQLPGQLVFYLLAGTITVALAWLSWNLLEKHMLQLKRFFPRRQKARQFIDRERA